MDSTDLTQLILRYLDRETTAQEDAALRAALLSDRAAQDLFVHTCRQHGRLREILAPQAASALPGSGSQKLVPAAAPRTVSSSGGSSMRSSWYIGLAAAGLALAAWAGMYFAAPDGGAVRPGGAAAAVVIDREKISVRAGEGKWLIHVPVSRNAGEAGAAEVVVRLTDLDGKQIAEIKKSVAKLEKEQIVVVEYDGKLSPEQRFTTMIAAELRVGGKEAATAVRSLFEATSRLATRIIASDRWLAGTTPAVRVIVVDAATGQPAAGAAVTAELGDGIRWSGKTDAAGSASVKLVVADDVQGRLPLTVSVRSNAGASDSVRRDVEVVRERKILLTSDKPIYQPGQMIFIRALALRTADLKPVGKTAVTIEVEDSKGNKVFKKELATDAFGIVSAEFQLGNELNMGNYRLRAILEDVRQEKTVAVQRYVLPKFKVEVKTDKPFYMPGEKVTVELDTNYFFGKPVAGATVDVEASKFDVGAFERFSQATAKTDAQGHAKFEIALPKAFVGQEIQQGNAVAKFEITILDTAEHKEVIQHSVTVAKDPILIVAIPESGTLVAGVENKIYVMTATPTGRPVAATVKVGNQEIKTDAMGVATFTVTPEAPKAAAAGQGGGQPGVEGPVVGGGVAAPALVVEDAPVARPAIGRRPGRPGRPGGQFGPPAEQKKGPTYSFTASARDAQGNKADRTFQLPLGERADGLLLRTDEALYKVGGTMKLSVFSAGAKGRAFVDIIKNKQTLLTHAMEIADGKGTLEVDLTPDVAGSVEVHAYRILPRGEIIRDTKLVYVSAAEDLRIAVKADRESYIPGKAAAVDFAVTDTQGRPVAAALGISIVDERVFALQELQPGLEKVYFTLEAELMKPAVQVTGWSLDGIINPGPGPVPLPFPLPQPIEVRPLPAQIDDAQLRRKQAARLLLATAENFSDPKINVNTADTQTKDYHAALRGKFERDFNAISAEINKVMQPRWEEYNKKTNAIWERVNKEQQELYAPVRKIQQEAQKEKDQKQRQAMFQKAQALARELAPKQQKIHQDAQNDVQKVAQAGRIPAKDTDALFAALGKALKDGHTRDAWGARYIALTWDHQTNKWAEQFDHVDLLVSAGPDGKMDTDDDVAYSPGFGQENMSLGKLQVRGGLLFAALAKTKSEEQVRNFGGGGMMLADGAVAFGGARPQAMMARGGGGPGGAVPEAMAFNAMEAKGGIAHGADGGDAGVAEAGPRIREDFPETLRFVPSLITGSDGKARLALDSVADSITTWRITTMANSAGGLLGSNTASMRVFQDFFIDLDTPAFLTQGDIISIPVAIHNYLTEPQDVTVDLEKADWFTFSGNGTVTRKLKAGEVGVAFFTINVKKVGRHPLLVRATGKTLKLPDAIRKYIEVRPYGQEKLITFNDRLEKSVSHKVTIPADSVEGGSRIFVKVYPGIFSQMVEGMDKILRMPSGCFEQTSATTYPNILVANYMKNTRQTTPEIQMKAAGFINQGYQKLLSFEVKGGGFSWFGDAPANKILTAFGVMEFADMAKVHEVDPAVISRTQNWLVAQQKADGSWDPDKAYLHQEAWGRIQGASALPTAYISWTLQESGYRNKEVLRKSVNWLRSKVKEADDPYMLALMANALVLYDRNDDAAIECLNKLLSKKIVEKDGTVHFSSGLKTCTYSHGDSAGMETTALAALALLRSGRNPNDTTGVINYLIKNKDPHGTWHSTQATILALKALTASLESKTSETEADIVIKLNGKEAGKFKITKKDNDVLRELAVGPEGLAGANNVEIVFNGTGGMLYQVTGRWYAPWGPVLPQGEPAMRIAVSYDKTDLATNDFVTCSVKVENLRGGLAKMVVADVGVPPGFEVDPSELTKAVEKKTLQKFSVAGRQVVLYVEELAPGKPLMVNWKLRAKYPLKAKTPESVAYQYYNPEIRAKAAPVELTVSK